MLQFQWFAVGPIPEECDLRQLGWSLVKPGAGPVAGQLPLLAKPARHILGEWMLLNGFSPACRSRVLAVGVSDPRERALLLGRGFGDVMGESPDLMEVELRARRIADALQALPRQRRVGALRLDLLARDGFIGGRGLGLHPREFLLLWRLADEPGRAVAPQQLRSDVWRLSFRPETNSLAVHISRLRAKLRIVGLDGLIETQSNGAYRLATERIDGGVRLPVDLGLDAHLRLGKEAGEHQPGIEDRCGTN